MLAFMLVGCGHDHAHDELGGHGEAGHGHNADGSHSDSAQSFSGATHKEGGITLLEETRKLLGVQTVEVQEQILPRRIQFTARVFDVSNTKQTFATGTVSTNDAALLRAGLPVEF
jgi:hypothetical protein